MTQHGIKHTGLCKFVAEVGIFLKYDQASHYNTQIYLLK